MPKSIATVPFLCLFFVIFCCAQDQLKMTGADGSEVTIGTKIDINEMHKKVFDALCDLKADEKPSRVYITIPFATNGLKRLVSRLTQCAQCGHRVSVILKTPILRKAKSKKVIDKAVSKGLLSVYNSNQLHAKDFLVIHNQSGVEDSYEGVFISGSANAGSDAGVNRNQEACVVSKNSEMLASAEKNFKNYIEMANVYDGSEVVYTPEKKQQAREQLLKDRMARSASDMVNLHVTSTVDTDVAKSREAMVTSSDVTRVIVETMTGYPEYVEKIPETVPVCLFVDKEAIVSHGDQYAALARKPNVEILVHIGSGAKHAKTICVKSKNKTILDISSTNNSSTSYMQYNTHFTMEVVDPDSPYKLSLDRQKQRAQSNVESSPVVLFNPDSPEGGKRIRELKEQRAAALERKNARRSVKRKLFESEDSPSKKRAIEAMFGTMASIPLYVPPIFGSLPVEGVSSSASTTTTTTTTTQQITRKLAFDSE